MVGFKKLLFFKLKTHTLTYTDLNCSSLAPLIHNQLMKSVLAWANFESGAIQGSPQIECV